MIATAALFGLDTDIAVSVTAPEHTDRATAHVAALAERLDRTVNRARPTAELFALDLAEGQPVMVSSLLDQLIIEALFFDDLTDGATRAVRRSDTPDYRYLPGVTFSASATGMTSAVSSPIPVWHRVQIGRGTVTVPSEVRLELLATARALLADQASAHLAEQLGCGVLVRVGNLAATAGAVPAGGWDCEALGVEYPLGAGQAIARVTAADYRTLPVAPGDARPQSFLECVSVVAESAAQAQSAGLRSHADPAAAARWLAAQGVTARIDTADSGVVRVGRVPATGHALAA
ncbi:FAD:protein FMN transferase [Williamsia soli]|uniref:FAD:protein FMN transferase n=1 Tax=Williamsia soli TaxID=364929 RepID=UPI001A9DB568|nr:FAD:protein FMN transferase [Williamsia soli]